MSRAVLFVALIACGTPPPQTMPAGGQATAGGSATAGGEATAGGIATAGGGSTSSTATTIRVHYPAGTKTLWLRGSEAPLTWFDNATLTKGADDTWSETLEVSTPTFELKPMLDADWSVGPNYVAARGSTLDIYPRFGQQNGRVTKLIDTFHSTKLARDRGIWVYLPPSYDENPTARFPVLYMHDGQNLFDPAMAFGGNEWRVDEALNAGARDGSIRELIVVGIENTPDRLWEYAGGAGPMAGGDAYRAMLIEELKPRIDSMLRTLPGRATTGIAGSSMGGQISAYVTATRPDVFGMTGDFSTSAYMWSSTVAAVAAITTRSKVYIDCGTSNDGESNTNTLYAQYLSVGYVEGVDIKKVLQQGASHSEFYWAQRFPGAAVWLFGPRQ
ncbi:MAG: alpha/beta hydrolase [Myxococcaceae bacterium]|nr:alpha/beta hydrolase [Myxococcaceae bacterium]